MNRPLNALIVDDSVTVRKMIIKLLSQTGLADFTFTEAEDGVDALAKYRAGETEIIFVDMNMPKMGGLEFIRALRSKHKKCPPTVMITAESSQERLAEAINEPGVDAFLLKPVDRDRLQTGLRKLVDCIPERTGSSVVPHGECVPRALKAVLAQACDLYPTEEAANDDDRRGGILLGMTSFDGSVRWSVVLGFTRASAAAVATKFAGYEIAADGPDLGDAIGEITSIVGGKIKKLLGLKGLTVNMSLPTVVSASDFEILLQHKSGADTVHFNSSVGKLWTIVTVGMDAGMIL